MIYLDRITWKLKCEVPVPLLAVVPLHLGHLLLAERHGPGLLRRLMEGVGCRAPAPSSPRSPSSRARWGRTRNWRGPAVQSCASYRLLAFSLNPLCLLTTTSLFLVILIPQKS